MSAQHLRLLACYPFVLVGFTDFFSAKKPKKAALKGCFFTI
jgi:hypothetical protein